MLSHQKLVTILLDKIEWSKFCMLLMKCVLLIECSGQKIVFRKIELRFDIQISLWKMKMCNYWHPLIKRSYKITKILLGYLLKCKILLNFTCTTKKFHDCHHVTLQCIALFTIIKSLLPSKSNSLSIFQSFEFIIFHWPADLRDAATSQIWCCCLLKDLWWKFENGTEIKMSRKFTIFVQLFWNLINSTFPVSGHTDQVI